MRPNKPYAPIVLENSKKFLEVPPGVSDSQGPQIPPPKIYDETSFRTVRAFDHHFKWKTKKRKNKKGKYYWQYAYFSVPYFSVPLSKDKEKKVFVVKKSNKLLTRFYESRLEGTCLA